MGKHGGDFSSRNYNFFYNITFMTTKYALHEVEVRVLIFCIRYYSKPKVETTQNLKNNNIDGII